jgi:hypothetical protein
MLDNRPNYGKYWLLWIKIPISRDCNNSNQQLRTEALMNEFWRWAASIPWFAWIAIIAILCGCATSMTKMIINHLERMERISRGDSPPSPKD